MKYIKQACNSITGRALSTNRSYQICWRSYICFSLFFLLSSISVQLAAEPLTTATEWTVAKPLTLDNGSTDAIGQSPQISSDHAGIWIMVYYGRPAGVSAPSDWEIMYSRSEDGGVSWNDPQPLHQDWMNDSTNDIYPRITTSGNGQWICSWLRGGTTVLSESNDGGLKWSDPWVVNITTYGILRDISDIAYIGNNSWLIVWADDGIMLSLSTSNGRTWNVPVFLEENSSSCGNYSCGGSSYSQASIAESTNFETAFVTYRVNSSLRLSNGGTSYNTSFGDSMLVHGHLDRVPGGEEMVEDGAGNWLIAKSQFNSGYPYAPEGYSITFYRGSANSGFTEISYPHHLLDINYSAKVAVDSHGNWLMLWNGSEMEENGVSSRQYLLAESNDYGATWSQPKIFDIGMPGGLQLKGNSRGQFIATWTKIADGTPTVWYSCLTKYTRSAVADWELYK